MHLRGSFISTILLLAVTLSSSALAQTLTPERERALKPKDSFKECEICPEMVVVPAGSFIMGSPANERARDDNEGPQRQIALAKAFAVARFEVTLDQFSAFVAQTGHLAGASVPESMAVLPRGTCTTTENGERKERSGRTFQNPGFPQTGAHPVTCVSWHDAKAYVAWLSKTTGKDYRLLTEAEWEFAARARTAPGPGPRYAFGDDENAMCRFGNGADQAAKATAGALESFKQKWEETLFPCSDGHVYTAPVGTFSANEFGLHDMHGNVWEMTEDCYGSYDRAPKDGSAAESAQLYCAAHVIRGGSWNDGSIGPYSLRAASRPWNSVDWPESNKGFRVARALSIP